MTKRLREDVVQSVIRRLGDRAHATTEFNVVGIHKGVDEGLVGAEGTTNLNCVVLREVTAAGEL